MIVVLGRLLAASLTGLITGLVVITSTSVLSPSSAQAVSDERLVATRTSSTVLPGRSFAVSMQVTREGEYVFVVAMDFSDADRQITGASVHKIEASSGRVLVSVPIPSPDPNRSITALTFDPSSNRVLVALSSDLFIFDAATLALLDTSYVWNRGLYSLLSDARSGRVFGLVGPTSATSARIVQLDPISGSIISEVAYSDSRDLSSGFPGYATPRLALDPLGSTLFALPRNHDELLVIDPQSMQITNRVNVNGASGSLALSPTAAEVFLTDPVKSVISRYSMTDLSARGSTQVGGRCPGWLAVDALGERAVIGHPCGGVQLQIFDPETGQARSAPLSVMSNGMSLWMSPDGRRIYSLSSSGTALETYEVQTRAEVRAKERAALPLPAAPRDIKVSVSGLTATLSWSPSTNARRSKIQRYLVTGKPGAVACKARAPRVSCRITGLTPGRTYAFGVRGENVAGVGPVGVSDFVTVPLPQPAQRPTPQPDPKPEQVFS